MSDSPAALPNRAYLLHITHYDPQWLKRKDTEEPFDPDTARAVIDALAEAGMTTLVIDPKDGVEYRSHPELKRHYTHPMSALEDICRYAESKGLEIAIKLNFSQSGLHQHNHWFRPHIIPMDTDDYFARATQIIDELIEAAKPKRFFHLGGDEDHWRGYGQYVSTFSRLRDIVQERGLRAMIWNDSACHWSDAVNHRDKSLAFEAAGPRDVIHVLWKYDGVDVQALERLRERGLAFWGAPGREPEQVRELHDQLLRLGGTGILLTRWDPCIPANREAMIEQIRRCGPVCAG